MFDAVIASDFHLGSTNCEVDKICDFLKDILNGTILTKKLILNGDTFDSLNFEKLKKKHWQVLYLIRRVINWNNTEVIWLTGNHDEPAETLETLLGYRIEDKYILYSSDKSILVTHGQSFDDFIYKHPYVTSFADFLYSGLQKIDRKHYIAKHAKHASKTFVKCSNRIETGAMKMAAEMGADIAVCGHTHKPIAKEKYFNSGSWVELPCTYITVKDGIVKLEQY